MQNFVAILVRSITFVDLNGNTKILPIGLPVAVSKITSPHLATDESGRRSSERVGSFIGSIGDDSFDICPTEFALLQ